MKALEVEIDGHRNESLAFRPLPGRTIRGRFDFNRVAEPMARLEMAKWPHPIPGQRIGLDPDGNGYIAEPLYDPEHAPTREKIAKLGAKLAPAVETFDGVDPQSWLYWLMRAVAAGVAKVVKGELPTKLPDSPRRDYIMSEPPQSSLDSLKASIDRQNELFAKLLEKLSK